jgi:ribosomal-protein-alanine N-acetyltransferase
MLGDIPEIIKYFTENETHLAPFDPNKPDGFYDAPFWLDRIPKHEQEFFADRAVRLFLFDLENNKTVLGGIGFSQISRGPFQACYLGYGISKKYEGKGMMYEALRAATLYAFHALNIHRIMANHMPENKRSASLLNRLGFQQECVAKEYLRINGAWRDHVLNSLHNPEWRVD